MFETVKLIRKVSNPEDHLIGHPLRINQSLHMYHHIKNHFKSLCITLLSQAKSFQNTPFHSFPFKYYKTEAIISLCFQKLKNKRNNENLSENNSRSGECSKDS